MSLVPAGPQYDSTVDPRYQLALLAAAMQGARGPSLLQAPSLPPDQQQGRLDPSGAPLPPVWDWRAYDAWRRDPAAGFTKQGGSTEAPPAGPPVLPLGRKSLQRGREDYKTLTREYYRTHPRGS